MHTPDQSPSVGLTRREALQRAALFLGAATLSSSLLEGVLHAQTVAPGTGGARALDATQLATAAALAERILPRTDTPGAIDVGVPAFIDRMYGAYLTAEERTRFASGLAGVDRVAQGRGGALAGLPAAVQDEIVGSLAARDRAFWLQLRELVIVGYFTSETVGKTVLHYDPVPGRYRGDIPLSEVGNVNWTR